MSRARRVGIIDSLQLILITAYQYQVRAAVKSGNGVYPLKSMGDGLEIACKFLSLYVGVS